MNKLLFIIYLIPFLTILGCGNDNSIRERELDLRERELELKEKALDEKQSYHNTTNYQEVKEKQSPSENDSDLAEGDGALGKIYAKEIKSPNKYLTADYSYKVTMIGNTIIEGSINNSAMVAGFKNVKLTVYFYSKTDLLLGQETFTIMEFVSSNGSISFKHKIDHWWDHISYSTYKIVSAEPY